MRRTFQARVLSNDFHRSVRCLGLVPLAFACQSAERAPLAGSATPTAAGAADTPVAPGTVARTVHYEMRVSTVEECAVEAHRERDGMKRVGVEVTLHARAELQVPANPYYAVLIDGENVVHEATLGGCTPALAPALVEPGETASGWLSFDIPRESAALMLAYAPRLAGGELEELLFRVSR